MDKWIYIDSSVKYLRGIFTDKESRYYSQNRKTSCKSNENVVNLHINK